jgi:hypothetical protein
MRYMGCMWGFEMSARVSEYIHSRDPACNANPIGRVPSLTRDSRFGIRFEADHGVQGMGHEFEGKGPSEAQAHRKVIG